MTAWVDALIRVSLQGALAIAIVFALFRLFPRISGSAQVWIWRVVALKLVLGLLLPITVYAEAWNSPLQIDEDPLVPWIVLLSLIGVLLTFLTVFRDWLVIRHLQSTGELASPSVASALTARLGLRTLPRIMVRNDYPRPMLSGSWKPTIHLPRNLQEDAQAMVLAHEMAHVKRRDLAWEWLFVAIDALFFFHPLVWLMRREHRIAQENACDTLALQATDASFAKYGLMLVDLTRSGNTRELALTSNMSDTYSALMSRIVRLHRGHAVLHPFAVAALVLGAVSLLPTWRSEYRTSVPQAGAKDGSGFRRQTPLSNTEPAPIRMRANTPEEGTRL